MTTKIETEYPSSPPNDESDGEEHTLDFNYPEEEEEEEEDKEKNNSNILKTNVADLLARLQSSGALLKKPKQEYRCITCDLEFLDWEEQENHLIKHISLPSVILDKLPSDDEDLPPSGDENWSDEDDVPAPVKQSAAKTPQKIDISQILKKTGISLKKTIDSDKKSSDSALNKLSGLGFTITKNSTPIKKEKPDDSEKTNDVMQKLGKLGGIKLKLKSDGNNTNSFKVVNGLKDFKASDDEEEGSGNEEDKDDQDFDDDFDKSGEIVGSEGEHDSDDQPISNTRKSSDSNDSEKNKRAAPKLPKGIQSKLITPKKEPVNISKVTPVKNQTEEVSKSKPGTKSAAKQVAKRGAAPKAAGKRYSGPLSRRQSQADRQSQAITDRQTRATPDRQSKITPDRQAKATPDRQAKATADKQRKVTPDRQTKITPDRQTKITPDRQTKITPDRQTKITPDRQTKPTPDRQFEDSDRRESNEQIGNVVVKQEVQDTPSSESHASVQELPIFSGPIKSERSTPPLSERSTPILARVKSEPETQSSTANSEQYNYNSNNTAPTAPLLPVKKIEDTSVTVIEINGDSNDEDDDCCVVSTTPAPDIKPIIPKVENSVPPPYSNASSYSTGQSNYNSTASMSSRLSTAPSTEKQHNFNWNAPDSKPPIDMLEKSADEMFESLLSSPTKKENMSISDASEYISLDTLGPQHTCDICNTRFTDISLLEEHKRVTGHSKSLVAPTSSTLMPYNHSSNILSSLLPVKQLAEQVGKLSTIGNNGPGFTHQQNVMINIQAYPGAGGVMVPPQPYNSYNPTTGTIPGQNLHGNYPHSSSNMYGSSSQPMSMPGQYQASNYMGQGYGQYPTPMSKSGYPSSIPPTSYSMASSPYSTASPLQSMQQSVYGQSSMMGQQPGSMGPPGSSPSHYAAASSPGGMKPPSNSGIKIQNIQTFPPSQMMGAPGQQLPGQPTGPDIVPGQMAPGQAIGGQMAPPTPIRMAAGANIASTRPRLPSVRGQRPTIRPGIQVHGQVRGGGKVGPRMPMKRPGAAVAGPGQKRRSDMLLPGKHDNEDCHVMAMQKQREGLPLIHSVQGAKDKLNLGSHISITKKTVNKEASAMANVLASRGISVKQKQKSRSPTPERPLPHIPNLGAGVSIKHTSRSSKFSIPEAKVGGGMLACKICKKMFMNHSSLQVHMSNAHPQSKIPVFKCDECPASYPKSLQLQHHKRVFHNVVGPNRELGLPVVDLSQEDNLKRLSNLGIYSFIPLANREQANGCFGIPVISVHNMQNGLTSSLQALGADGLLSLGPLKPLPNS